MSETARTTQTAIRFPDDLLDALRDVAREEDRSLASLVVHFARQGLNARQREKTNA